MSENMPEIDLVAELTNLTWLDKEIIQQEDPEDLVIVSMREQKKLRLTRKRMLFLSLYSRKSLNSRNRLEFVIEVIPHNGENLYGENLYYNVFDKLARSNCQFVRDFIGRILEKPAETKESS